MVLSAISLLSERGVAGASFSEVIERSGAPRGSIYHHFPEGKESLVEEAIALVGKRLGDLLQIRDGATPKQVVLRFVSAWRTVLSRSNFRGGCSIAAAASERVEYPALADRAAAVFIEWERGLQEALQAAGLPRARALSAASLMLASVEGALVLCRARREMAPLDRVQEALVRFVEELHTK